VYIGLRKYFGVIEYYSDAYYLGFNLTDTHVWLYMALMFNIFLVFAWKNYTSKPKFLKRAVLMAPFFIIIHFTMTIMREARLWLPVFPIFLAMGLFSLFPEDVIVEKKAQVKNETATLLAKFPAKALYIISIFCFFVFFVFFYQAYDKGHLKEAGKRRQVESFINLSDTSLKMNLYQEALNPLNAALSMDPNNPEVHLRLAKIYNYYVFDRDKAVTHFKAVLEFNPYHSEKKSIEWELRRLESMR
jgi:tetratricopeptide (TPR) repeat protein